MDVEFHYCMTYLTATKAGLSPQDARVIAYASQYVDDNNGVLEIDSGRETAYQNFVSQTMNIAEPAKALFRIYPLFHFIPGEPLAETAQRKDGKLHWLTTTPNSPNANAIIDNALAAGDHTLYRIGIAAHSYVDTWAHQNFVGFFEGYNAMEGMLESCAPNVGHADAKHAPDWPGLVWQDCRLRQETVNNKVRFIDAATHLLEKLARTVSPAISDDDLKRRKTELQHDLGNAIGPEDPTNRRVETRIACYRGLAETPGYGGEPLPEYDEDEWLDDAVTENVRGLPDHFWPKSLNPLKDELTWKHRPGFRDSHWWHFQEAVKAHQVFAWDHLLTSNLKHVDIDKMPHW
ncbi:DUF6765 family protein [Azospirillum sp. sgz301742]